MPVLSVCRGANGGRIATPPVKRLLWLLSLRKKKVTINLKECNFLFILLFQKITPLLDNYRDIVSKKCIFFSFFHTFLVPRKYCKEGTRGGRSSDSPPLLLTPPPRQTAKGVPPLESPFRASTYVWDHSEGVCGSNFVLLCIVMKFVKMIFFC